MVPESCARFVACQDVGKLLSTFQKLGADTDERELRALTGHDEDAKAILNRCVFVEVREHVIRPELRKTPGGPPHHPVPYFSVTCIFRCMGIYNTAEGPSYTNTAQIGPRRFLVCKSLLRFTFF